MEGQTIQKFSRPHLNVQYLFKKTPLWVASLKISVLGAFSTAEVRTKARHLILQKSSFLNKTNENVLGNKIKRQISLTTTTVEPATTVQ